MAKAVHPMHPMRLVLVLAVLALSSCKAKTDQAAPKVAAVKLPLATAAMQSSPTEITLTGLLAADQRSEVTADTQGKVVAVLVERGQRVKMGQPVVQLDVRTAALSAREAQANLAAARAQKQLAEEECKRAQTLLDRGAITRSEYDRQITQCTSTLQQVSAAQARADMISKSISDGQVRAPFDGQVTQKSVSPGEWVAPGRTLFTLVDDDPLKIELSVPEAAVRAIQPGQKVTLSAVAHRGKRYTATVSRIGGEIGRTRSLIVEATLDPRGDDTALVPGMFAEAQVVIGQDMRPVIPADAIVQDGRLDYVFVVKNGELHKTIVQVGPETAPGARAILKGLAGGDKVASGLYRTDVDPGKEAKATPSKPAEGSQAPQAQATASNGHKQWIVTRAGDKIIEVKDGLRVEELPGTAKAAEAASASKAPDQPASAPDAKPAEAKPAPRTEEK
jgi:membrane fusion protein (multidrug efflux system)